MALTDLLELKDDAFSLEGKLTSVILTDDGGTITAKGDATLYGSVHITYNLSVNPKVPGQGIMTGIGNGIDDDGELAIGSLNGVWERKGHEITMYCMDDISDGNLNVAVVRLNLKDDNFRVDWSQIAR
tara:strand:+ start:1141 stop:1524 length:384 start_codon:yes stop_codon:yes gene_type:complete